MLGAPSIMQPRNIVQPNSPSTPCSEHRALYKRGPLDSINDVTSPPCPSCHGRTSNCQTANCPARHATNIAVLTSEQTSVPGMPACSECIFMLAIRIRTCQKTPRCTEPTKMRTKRTRTKRHANEDESSTMLINFCKRDRLTPIVVGGFLGDQSSAKKKAMSTARYGGSHYARDSGPR